MTENWQRSQEAVLGSALIEPDLVPKVVTETRAADFSGPAQTVYEAMRRLFQNGTPVDIISLAAALGQEYRSYLAQLMEVTPTAANLDYYISLCREQAKVYSVQVIAGELLQQTTSEGIRKLLEKANGLMVDKTSLKIRTMEDLLHSFMERHTRQATYLSWPVPDLNDRLYCEPGDFILVGGYPSAGKSAWSLQCAWHWAKENKVGFFSLETNPDKLFDRLSSHMMGLTMDDIKRNNISQAQWDDICRDVTRYTSGKLEIIPAAGMNPADIRSVITMRRYQIVIVDYVQLIDGNGGNRTEQVTNISLALHRMAQDMGVTIVALSQLKRKGDDSAPESSDLRESGQLEQDADVIMMLKLANKDEPEGNRKLYITKNKEGTCPMITLAFDGRHQTFSKALKTRETVNQLKAAAKQARRQNREAAQQAMNGQMELLPPSTPVPFED